MPEPVRKEQLETLATALRLIASKASRMERHRLRFYFPFGDARVRFCRSLPALSGCVLSCEAAADAPSPRSP